MTIEKRPFADAEVRSEAMRIIDKARASGATDDSFKARASALRAKLGAIRAESVLLCEDFADVLRLAPDGARVSERVIATATDLDLLRTMSELAHVLAGEGRRIQHAAQAPFLIMGAAAPELRHEGHSAWIEGGERAGDGCSCRECADARRALRASAN